jgi:hypothetical protein
MIIDYDEPHLDPEYTHFLDSTGIDVCLGLPTALDRELEFARDLMIERVLKPNHFWYAQDGSYEDEHIWVLLAAAPDAAYDVVVTTSPRSELVLVRTHEPVLDYYWNEHLPVVEQFEVSLHDHAGLNALVRHLAQAGRYHSTRAIEG